MQSATPILDELIEHVGELESLDVSVWGKGKDSTQIEFKWKGGSKRIPIRVLAEELTANRYYDTKEERKKDEFHVLDEDKGLIIELKSRDECNLPDIQLVVDLDTFLDFRISKPGADKPLRCGLGFHDEIHHEPAVICELECDDISLLKSLM